MDVRGTATPAGRGRLLALPLLAILMVSVAVGAAARSGAAASGSTDPQASIDAATVVLTLFGMSLLLTFAYLAWNLLTADRGSGGPPPQKRRGVRVRTQVLVLAAVLAVLTGLVLLLVWSHPSGHHGGAFGGGSSGRLPPPSPRAITYSTAVGGLTAGSAALLLLVLLALWSIRRTSRRRRGQPFLAHLEVPEAVAPAPSADELRQRLEEVAVPDPLAEPDPRRAVIAAWLAMTEAIGRCWREREASEAPFEYLEGALTGAGVRPAAAHRLTTLFEEARWGGRPVGEETRAEAVAALDDVRSDLLLRAALVGAP